MTSELKHKIKDMLLEYTHTDKLFLASNKILNIAKSCETTPANIVSFIQELFIKSDNDFKYEIAYGKHGFKVIALLKSEPLNEEAINKFKAKSIDLDLAKYINNQFSELELEKRIEIALFHKTLANVYDLSDYYLIAFSKSEVFYNKLKQDYSKADVDNMLGLILNYGYACQDNQIFWKIYNPYGIIDNNKEHLLIDDKSIKQKKDDIKDIPINEDKPKIIQKDMSVKDAITLIANEYGMSLARDDSKHKLEELIATTNELINNFNELPDWEKLKSWDDFMQVWQTIMREAINDRN